jgi:thiamine biosynthesis lipoprotein
MGTVFSIDVRSPGFDGAVLDDVMQWLHEADATFSTYRADSQISRLSRGDITIEQCRPDVREVLARCDELRRQTAGYFSAYPDGSLDPSGLVKGWAIEHASDMLAAAGSSSHCVNGGGDVQCVGESAPGRPWHVGIAHPLHAGQLVTVVAGRDIAVATSGTAERGAHVFDPHGGRTPDALASVTVIGHRLAEVDAYATAAFAMGQAAGNWIAGLPGHWGFGVHHDGTTWATDGFSDAAEILPAASGSRG